MHLRLVGGGGRDDGHERCHESDANLLWAKIDELMARIGPVTGHVHLHLPESFDALPLLLAFARFLGDGSHTMPAPAATPGEMGARAHTGSATPGAHAPAPNESTANESLDGIVSRWRDEMTARGVRPGSIQRMISTVERVAHSQGWKRAEHVDYTGAVAFLAARRRQDKPWSGPTYDQAVSTLRTFGEFLRRSGLRHSNPLMDLQACGEQGEAGSRALTPEDARRILIASIDRHLKSRRAKGCAPLYWLTLFYTGLRYSEAEAMRWKDIDFTGETAFIYTDPKWKGNKGGRRDRIPLHPRLAEMLRAHRSTVPDSSSALVFPIVPSRRTWQLDRERAGIPERDGRNRPATPHSCRKSFCTWLDAMVIPRGLVSRLARHATTLTEAKYIDHDPAEEMKAIAGLPLIWPDGVKIFSDKSWKTVESVPGNANICVATPSDSPSMAPTLTQTSRPETIEVEGVATQAARRGAGFSPSPRDPAFDGQNVRESARLSASSVSIGLGNGHFLNEKQDAPNTDPLSGVIHALTLYV